MNHSLDIFADFQEFKNRFVKQMQQPLPGYEAQYKMAREFRDHPIDTERYHANARLGAVLVLLYPLNDRVHTVLIQRPTYEGVHSAQVAFPGGKKEETDSSLITTALREAQEEVGTQPQAIEVIGSLTHLYIPPSNFLVTPVVAFSNEPPVFMPQKEEVDEILQVGLHEFFKENVEQEKTIYLQQNINLRVKYYDVHNKVIWGATAMMIAELKEVVGKFTP